MNRTPSFIRPVFYPPQTHLSLPRILPVLRRIGLSSTGYISLSGGQLPSPLFHDGLHWKIFHYTTHRTPLSLTLDRADFFSPQLWHGITILAKSMIIFSSLPKRPSPFFFKKASSSVTPPAPLLTFFRLNSRALFYLTDRRSIRRIEDKPFSSVSPHFFFFPSLSLAGYEADIVPLFRSRRQEIGLFLSPLLSVFPRGRRQPFI